MQYFPPGQSPHNFCFSIHCTPLSWTWGRSAGPQLGGNAMLMIGCFTLMVSGTDKLLAAKWMRPLRWVP